MPGHSSIIAFDIQSQKILWQNEDLVFLFIHEKNVYGYKQRFEDRNFYKINIFNGEVVEELGNDSSLINSVREKSQTENQFYQNYHFPQPFNAEENSSEAYELINKFKVENVITGSIECIELNNIFLFNCHLVKADGKLQNVFYAVDIELKKIIFKEVLDQSTSVFIPDSFFVKDNLIFLLLDKIKLLVCSIKN